ncbi:hypothetical protein VE01_02081 [Pseudogymnoascus verrucosus]|uniref:Uncharacterized protein n=1 Tax=Pseudogymnoascus verrucosus TaxID=342668 RepID=A0A1B8GVB6_9PEZI|nr:uncharacterized protein VE01_02081 [Pseudogymnoascus verrucosus]OBT99784.2 hypothetical protein VE01_02081 [Pseudogymnoascus verrucosus]
MTPRIKSEEEDRASLDQEKHGQAPTPTMATTAPVAIMTTEGSQSPTKVATTPVAVMSTEGSQAAGSRANPLEIPKIDVDSHDSDSDEYDPEDTLIIPGFPCQLNRSTSPVKAADNGSGKAAEKPAESRLTSFDTTGLSVVPSRYIRHPFSNKNKMRLEQSETSSNPPTIDKPAMTKKPFTNLMTSTAPKKITTFEPPKQRIQKPGDTKKEVGLVIHSESGIQNTDSNMCIQKLKKPQLDNIISPAEVSNVISIMEDTPQDQQVNEVEVIDLTTTTTRTKRSTSSKKRTASTMLRAADEPNPQAERSVRARLLQHAAPYNSSRAISDILQFEHVIITMTEAAIGSVTVSSFAGAGADEKTEECKEKYLGFLTSFIGSVGSLKGELLEIAEREE